jgi:hypothetical protein
MRDICLQMMLSLIEICILVMVVPCFLAMPGMAFTCMCCICAFTIMLISWPMNGEQVVRCVAKGRAMENQAQYADERWVYINGAMTRYWTPGNTPNSSNEEQSPPDAIANDENVRYFHTSDDWSL